MFIWLGQVLAAACGIFDLSLLWYVNSSCGIWDIVPWPGIKPRPPTLEAWSLSHWTTREVLRINNFDDMSAAAAAKSCQSCPTLCDPVDGSPPGSPVRGILQARTLEWVAISFSSAWKWKVNVKSLSCVWLLATSWTVAYQAPPSMGFSRQEYWSRVPLPSPWLHDYSRPKKTIIFKMHYLWLCWVSVALCGLSLVVEGRDYSLLLCAGFAFWWLLLLQGMGSRLSGFSSCSPCTQ